MQKNTIIKVLNRDNGQTIYSIPEMNGLRRVYGAGEVKQVTFEELQKLTYIPGGMSLLKNNLVILNNKAAVKELLGEVEPEYLYTEDDVRKLMLTGSLDEFLDCLDFAPTGVIDLIKNLAVSMPLNDVRKREAILEKTGFNVDNAIRIQKQAEEPDEEPDQPTKYRRVQKSAELEPEVTTATRRVVKREV